ncbi:hypothetical protein Tco_1267237, partial [Tanacetum coccineum]
GINTRTRKVEENLHINFLENKPNVAGSGPEWLFDIDSLTKSMNFEPVTARNQTNGDAGIETNVNAWQAGQEKPSDHEYILLPLMFLILHSLQKEGYANNTNRVSGQGFDNANDQERMDSSSQDVNTVGPSINTTSENINTGSSNINTASPIPNDPSMQSLEATGIFDDAYDDREKVGAEADLNNLETTMNFSYIPTTRIHKDRPIEQIIRDLHSAPLTRRTSQQNLEELGLVSYIKKQRRTNHKVKSSKARRRVILIVSEDEDELEDPSKQGRKIAQIDKDDGITLVQMSAQTQGRHEHDFEVPNFEFIAFEDDYTAEPDITIANVPVSTAGAEVSTANPEVKTAAGSLVFIRRSATKRKDKGKAIMKEAEPIPKKKKLQLEQERLVLEEALRLQERLDEEERQRIDRVHEDACTFNAEEWDNIQA